MTGRKHTLTFTEEEIKALMDRLVPISPVEYDLQTYSCLRNLYGRFSRILSQECIGGGLRK